MSIPTDITLADSLGFECTAECIYRGDIDSWSSIMYLGGMNESGWFGLQHNGTDPNTHTFMWSNNCRAGYSIVGVPVNTELVCKLDRNGLTINGALNRQEATLAYNKAQVVTGSWDKRIAIRSWVLLSNGERVIDVHAVSINGVKCLYDYVSRRVIPAVG